MKVNDSESVYCSYCKKILIDKHEKELQHHVACEQEVNDFSRKENLAIEKLKLAFGIDSLENTDHVYKGTCKYKYDKQGEITDVSFRNYPFTSLPNSLTSLTKLEKLSIKYYLEDYRNIMDRVRPPEQLIHLPENFGDLKNLRHLNLSECSLFDLPESFGNLSNLQTVTFDRNQIFKYPNFEKLQNLLSLDLTDNSLIYLPQGITELKNLLILNLRTCGLTSGTLPDTIGNLKNLKTLNLDKNQLTSLPESIGNLTKLQVLNLDGNWILETLPNSIKDLLSLQKLFLSCTGIQDLPKAIGKLKKLKIIGLSPEQLESFVKFAKNLPDLQKVFIITNYYWNYEKYNVLQPYDYPYLYKFVSIDNFSSFNDSVQNFLSEFTSKGGMVLAERSLYEKNKYV